MIDHGILNPHVLSLLARTRHTNTLVIADRGFPSWPGLETIDLSLIDDVPTVLQVLTAVRRNFVIGQVWMAREFLKENAAATRHAFSAALDGVKVSHLSHADFKLRVPSAVGLIRTGDTIQYSNMIVTSA